MSVARKRAKVKKKRSAAAKRPKRTAKKKTAKASVNTKKRRVKPKPRRSKRPGIVSKAAKAAIKGWETRRRKKAEAQAEHERLKQAAQSSIDARLAFLRLPEVAAQIRDQLIRTELIRPGMVETEETQILSRLIVAEQLGNFDETARALSVEFDWDIRDVYTLWKSP